MADVKSFRSSVQRAVALVSVAGIDFVDTDRLMEAAAAKSENAAKAKATRAETPKTDQTPGQRIGLIRARLGRAPKLLANKERAITAAQNSVTTAANAYDKQKAETMLATLKTGLENITRQREEDMAALTAILSGAQAA